MPLKIVYLIIQALCLVAQLITGNPLFLIGVIGFMLLVLSTPIDKRL